MNQTKLFVTKFAFLKKGAKSLQKREDNLTLTLTVVQTEGLGMPEGSLRRKQQMKIAKSRIIRRTTPPILQRKTKRTKSLIKLYPHKHDWEI